MTNWNAIAADWASESWIAVGYRPDDTPAVAVYDDIDTLWSEHDETASRIIVDIPIGLCESKNADEICCRETDGELTRQCNDLARSYLGPRYRSVFTAPCREAAHKAAADPAFAAVNATNKTNTGNG